MRSDIVLQGSLDFLSLGDILQLLGGNGCSGTLTLISPYAAEAGRVHLSKGNPVNASAGKQTGLDALYALFGWTEGRFEFSEAEMHAQREITKSRMSIILDGLKMLDDGQIQRLGKTAEAATEAETAMGAGAKSSVVKGPLVDYMYVVDEEDFYDGELIVEEGKHGGWMWVLLEGVVDILKESPSGPLNILQVGTGSFVGSISSFVIKEHTRNASARAVGNVQLGVMDSQRLGQEYAKTTYEFRSFVLSLDRRLKMVTNRAVDCYSRTADHDAYLKNRKKFVISNQGDKRLFRILRGKAAIVRQTDKGSVTLAELHADDYIGDIPFLDLGHEPDSALVLVSDDFKCQVVKADDLRQEFELLSAAFRNLVENVATYIRKTTDVLLTHYQKMMKW